MGGGARIAVIGGGIIGLACAWRLARDGHRVTLFDAAREALEASWAAAGMLAPHNEAEERGPLHDLGTASLERWPGFIADLEVDPTTVDFRDHGSLVPVLDDDDTRAADRRQALLAAAGISCDWLTGAALGAAEPALGPCRGALRLPGAQVNPRAVTQLLRERCADGGVDLRYDTPVQALEPGRVWVASDRSHPVDQVVLAAGAWTPTLAELTGLALDGEPVKGQMLLLRGGEDRIHHFVHCRHAYCVPRAGSGVVVGSTMVWNGFDRSQDEHAIADLAAGARRVFPHLAHSRIEETWTGLRPRLAGGLPLLARIRPDLVVATGHFRNGILLTPITADIVADLIADRPSPLTLAPFAHSPA